MSSKNQKDQSLLILIPLMIIIAFTTKGLSLYYARATMIGVGESIKKRLQFDMLNNLVGTDTQIIDKKHSGKFISNITYDVTHITHLLSNACLLYTSPSPRDRTRSRMPSSA